MDLVQNKGEIPARVRRKKRNARGRDSDDDEGNGDWNGDWNGDDTSQPDDEWTLTSIETPQESVETRNIIPEKCKHPAVKSTKSFRELTKAEVDRVENKGEIPARVRRKKRKSCAEVYLAEKKT